MKRKRIHLGSTRDGAMDFDDLYDEISHDWQQKAKVLQTRRWHKLKQEIEGTTY